MTKEEILKQLPDEFETLSRLGKLGGPPVIEGFQPTILEEKKSLFKSFFETFNPFVPIGLALTVFFLGNGLRHMVLKNTRQSQMMMRGRVLAQGFTVAALVGGVLYETDKKKRKSQSN